MADGPEALDDRRRERVDDGDGRERDEQPGHTEQRQARGECEDRERDRDPGHGAIHQWREVARLQDVRQADQRQDRCGGEPALRREGHEREDAGGDDPAEVGHEPADEHDHGERPGERDPEQREVDEVRDAIGCGRHRGAPEIATHLLEGDQAAARQALDAPVVELAGGGRPRVIAVLEQVERQEPAEDQDRDERRDRRRRAG